ncbi:MAG TPA: SPFH domain-containing protein [Tepidisphaeraceae bacterium]|jgi:flotillin
MKNLIPLHPLAQLEGVLPAGGSSTIYWLLLVAFVALLFISFVTLLTTRYKRCPSNRVLVIYGKVSGGNTAKCVHGGASFVWPLIQDFAYLSLEPLQISIPLKDALSAENIRVSVPSVFTVAIGTEPEVMQNASIRLLGLNSHLVQQQAQDIIFGQLRQVIASMRIEDINRDREAFLQNIQKSLEPELRKIGLVLINVNITDITDESGYIQAIGQKAASQAIQQARGDVADQEKLGEVRVAEAQRERAVQVANANSLREIGIRQAGQEQAVRVAQLTKEQTIGESVASREQAVRLAELTKETQIAQQTAAFEQETQVKLAEQKKRISVADANAKAVAGEARSQAEIASTQAELQVKQAEAYQIAETKKREAEAAVQEAQNRAMAKAALADAERVEAEQRAQLEAPAKALKAKTIVEAEADAERRRVEAIGEAGAIYAKLEAEARGQYEMLARKAEGLKSIVEACGGSQQAFQMLLLEHLDHLADASAKAISNIKFDKVVVWDGAGNSTGNFLQNLSRTLPPMLSTLKDIGGVELPESLIKLHTDGTAPPTNGHAKTDPVRGEI